MPDFSCPFCPHASPTATDLAAHVILTHPRQEIGGVSLRVNKGSIRCFCGKWFKLEIPVPVAPLFHDWARSTGKINRFAAHLERSHGLVKHLDDLMLDRIGTNVAREREREREIATTMPWNVKSNEGFFDLCRQQGLPDGFDLPGFTVAAKCKAVGNGVPWPMAIAIAGAVKEAVGTLSTPS